MPVGVVKYFNEAKGYGFIRRHEGEADVYVRAVDIKGEGYRRLDIGSRVRFELVTEDNAAYAMNVEAL